MPKCYQLVGVPASGKTTWLRSQVWTEGMEYISTDHHVHEYAKQQGKTYREVFEEYMPTAVELMAKEVVAAREAGRDILWDQTSTTVKSRARKFRMLPDYWHVAVVFQTPAIPVLKERLALRVNQPIPWEVVQGMLDNFEMPTNAEGFAEIWRV